MKKHCILLFFCCLNILMNTAGAYNLKQVADKEYMSNSAKLRCARTTKD